MELYQLTIQESARLLKEKKISSVELTRAVLDRIKQVEDKVGSYLSVLEEDALHQANEADLKLKSGENTDILMGIPVAIKDNICTQGVATTCASKILEGFVPPYDATVTQKIKAQGGVIIGKANLDEFAMGSSTENSYYKKTKNPYDIERVPGGSSGGSAACVSADEAIYALGSDTGGSIRQPASFCGIVGMKPTYGTVSRWGLVAFASSLDQIGPMTKDVTDCAIVLNTITGHDKRDSTSLDVSYPDYTQSLVNDVKGMKIGIPQEYMGDGIKDEVKEAIYQSAKELERLGAVVKECSLSKTKYALPAYYLISSAEASANLARYDGIKYGYSAAHFNSLIDLYKTSRSEGFGEEVKRRIMLGTYVLSSGYYDAYYKKAQQVRTLIRDDFEAAFSEFDVLLTPSSPVTAWKFGEMSKDPMQMYAADICTVSVNIAGLPSIVVPCGVDSNNMPIGLQLIGKPFGEPTLLKTAFTFEKNTGHHTRRPVL
jgi:aspartyl-tRNA(Asn)/glutamyl-tRNA(Gln) amidotransferase subunit A